MTQRLPDPRTALASPLALALTILIPAAALARPARKDADPSAANAEVGVASWHAPARSSRLARTASGRAWINGELVAAQRSMPFGSRSRVVNLRNGRNVVVQITDRGPFKRGRIIDLSQRAAVALDLGSVGCGPVRLEKLPAGE